MKHGGNVWEGDPARWLDFSANLRPEGTPEWVTAVMQKALSDARYYPDRSMRAARKGLAQYLGVDEACVLPTAGGAAAIDMAITRGKGRVLLSPPTFGEYAERAHARGREVCESTETVCPGDTVVICNPNNPTGAAIAPEKLLKTHRRITSCGGELLVDEAFVDFCPEFSLRYCLRQGLMIAGSLTKTLCIPGVRLGYVLAMPEIVAELQVLTLPWSLNMLAAAVCAALPRHREEMEADRKTNRVRRVRFAEALVAHGAMVSPSQVNFLLVDFRRDMTADAARLKEEGILVRTCESFSLPPSVWRLAVKTDKENERLMKAIWRES